ncbi:MAG: chromophore lyase CpcT/CpeT [Proteobacteria bacterium]|nr:chromophore lyase CpcT/CpeT [Pseudomonadota bacterium]
MLMPQNSRATVLAGLVFLIGGCASVPERGAVELATLLEGTFKTPANSSDDPMTVRQVRFVAAGLPGTVLYWQIDTGAEAKVYRQRVTVLTEAAGGVVRGTTYAFNQPALFVNAWDKMSALEALTPADLKPGFEANSDADCDMKYRRSGSGWRGTVDPNVCRFWSSRRNAERGLGAVSEIDSAGLRQTEWAFDEAGKLAFGSGPDKLITMVRQ